MKLTAIIAATILHGVSIRATPIEDYRNSHSPSLVPRAHDNDRGTWVFRCAGAEGACNNACYSVFCRKDGSEKMYFDPDNNNDHHRKQSGCETSTGGRAVCGMMPFSQTFSDVQGLTEKTQSCDEWPMAEVLQGDWEKRKDNPNSLRCIDRGENGSGGSQLSNFLDLRTKQPKRKGDDDFQKGDYWKVEFDIESKSPGGADPNLNKLQYCKKNPDCTNDGYEFHLSKLSGTNGNLANPYDYDKMNRYALFGNDKDIAQCSVHLNRRQEVVGGGRGGSITRVVYEATVSQQDQQKGDKQTGRPTDNSPLIVKGLSEDLYIYPNTKSIADFKSDAKFKIGNFEWHSTTTGLADNPKSDKDKDHVEDPDPKRYCSVGKADNNKGTQTMDCWFPCFYKS